MSIALIALAVASISAACAHNQTAQPINGGSGDLGALQIDVREETHLKEGVAGATVELTSDAKASGQASLRRVTADTSGKATFDRLTPARYAIRVWAAGHDTVTEHVAVRAGQLETVRVAIRDDHCTVVVTSSGPVCM